MEQTPAERLAAELAASTEWPLPRERDVRRKVIERRAFRRGERDVLKRLANWSQHTTDGTQRDYVVDPLGRVISRAHADFLFGEDPRFAHTDEKIQARIDKTVTENRLPAQLHRAVRVCVSEGEVWWKLHVNAEIVADTALIEFRSRLSVVPLMYGDRVIACAFVTERQRESVAPSDDDSPSSDKVWRHAEIHGHGVVLNVLYCGTDDRLGDPVDLSQVPACADLDPKREHGLPMIAGRVVNDIDDDPTLGESDLDQVRDELLAVNEALTIATENARLTGQDRIFTAGRFMGADGSFDSSLQVYTVEQEGQTLGETDSRPPIVAIEKHYDAEPLWLHLKKLVGTILTRVGLVPQFIGDDGVDGGNAESGIARRVKFLPTINAALGKAREWDYAVPHILDLMLALAALPVDQGGLGQGPYTPEKPPTVVRGDVLPADEAEDVQTHVAAVAGEIESRETAIRRLNPDRDEKWIKAELDRISGDLALPELPPVQGV